MKTKWKVIDDNRVKMIWYCRECGQKKTQIDIAPTFYQDNGTPLCDCGEDMSYSHTEILCE